MITWKEHLSKYFTNLVSALTLAGVTLFVWNFWEDRQLEKQQRQTLEERYGKLTNTQEAFVQLSQTMAQLATSYKEQAELAKEVALGWKELAVERGERIKLKSETIVTVDPTVEKQEDSDYTFLTPEGSKGYSLNELRIAGQDSPAIGYILVKNDGEVYKKNYKFEVRVEQVQLKDDLTGKIRIVSRAFLVPLENGLAEEKRPDLKKWKGEEYPLKVTGGETVVDPQEPMITLTQTKGFVPWSLNLNAGFGIFGAKGGELDTKATVDTNLAGYGISKQNLDWKFGHIGANYSTVSGLGLHLTPFSYRPLPAYLTNTYIGPGLYVTPDNYGYFLGLNVGF
jgi:hypothetical protein